MQISQIVQSTGGGEDLACYGLSDRYRAQIETSFQADFKNVKVHARRSPAWPCVACALGEEIFLFEEFFRLPEISQRFVLAHELAHVVQQREGRCAGWTGQIVTDVELEREASRWAAAALRGEVVRRIRTKKGATLTRTVQFWTGEKSQGDVEQEIKEYFPEITPEKDPDAVETFSKMGAFLEDQNQVEKYLMELEKELVEELDKIRGERKSDMKEGKNYHALARVLERREREVGFDSVEGMTIHLTGFVPPGEFRKKLLKLGYHWKDPGAGAAHGEWTHRIQWYLLTKSKTVSQPASAFEALADKDCISDKKMTVGGEAMPIGMWDVLFDRFETSAVDGQNAPKSNTGRAPNFLNKHIKQDASKQWPTLAAYLTRRDDKRDEQANAWMAAVYGMESSDPVVGQLKIEIESGKFDSVKTDASKYQYALSQRSMEIRYQMRMKGDHKKMGENIVAFPRR